MFESHDFIMVFAKEFEPNYVDLLNSYKNNAHRSVHAQIALFLARNINYFKIEKRSKVMSKTVFGFNNPNEFWIKQI